MKRVIFWFRRDIRVHDNTGLNAAVQEAEEVMPVFILEEALGHGPDVGAARLAFLLQSLSELQSTLRKLGYPLIVRRGRSEMEIPKLAQEIKAEAVFCNKRYEPYAQTRDHRVFSALNSSGIGFQSCKDAVVWEEQEILNLQGSPYTVFTPYAKAWRSRRMPKPVSSLPARARLNVPVRTEALPIGLGEFGHHLTQKIPPPGEATAIRALREFIADPLKQYTTNRDFPALRGTSELSPHLRCGTLGIRTVIHEAEKAAASMDRAGSESCESFLKELIWREFYLQVLHNFPHVTRGSFRPEFDKLSWSGSDEHFQAWCAGMTGYPMVDAAMRCLNATGWMHNRLRMIVAMFLTKDLLINWRRGERYFMQQLVDGDLAANNGGWQWSAGTGTDAAPYFRIFNPVTQGKKFDPRGDFIRRWIPELGNLNADEIHEPWKSEASKYPARIVIHEEQRPKAIAMYEAVGKKFLPRKKG